MMDIVTEARCEIYKGSVRARTPPSGSASILPQALPVEHHAPVEHHGFRSCCPPPRGDCRRGALSSYVRSVMRAARARASRPPHRLALPTMLISGARAYMWLRAVVSPDASFVDGAPAIDAAEAHALPGAPEEDGDPFRENGLLRRRHVQHS